jgi:16S rRNA U516 pseudouridylate synthase RsuA-like enzyme
MAQMTTTVFDLAPKSGYRSLRALARAMGVDVSMLTRVRSGEVGITHRFITGAQRAFPDKSLDDLFHIDDREPVA